MENLERALTNNSLVIPTIFLALGIFIQNSMGINIVVGMMFIVCAVTCYLIIIYKSSTPVKSYKLRMMHYLWLALSFSGVGILFASFNDPVCLRNLSSMRGCLLTGEIYQIKESTFADVLMVDVKNISDSKGNSINQNFPMLLKLVNSEYMLKEGDIVRLKCDISEIKDNPNSFESGYSKMMAAKGVYYTGNVYGSEIEVIDNHKSVRSISVSIRNYLEKVIENTHIQKQTQNFLITLLLGDKTYLDSQIREIFADAGVAHVLALSGMHVGIIAGIFLFLLFPLNFAGKYKIRLIISAVMLWIYAFISGCSPSTIRACLMASFAVTAIILERKRYIFNSLFCASFVILLFSPRSLYDVGFQLSFICVASLAAFTSHTNWVNHRKHPKLYKLSSILSATVAATFGSWIITAFNFNAFPLAFLPANILILPLLPYYIMLAIIYVFLSTLGIELQFLSALLDIIYGNATNYLQWLGAGNYIEINVSLGMVVIWCLGLILLSLYLNFLKWNPFKYIGIIALLITVILIPLHANNVKEGSFIISNEYHHIRVVVKSNDTEKQINLKRGCVSVLSLSGVRILSVDCDINDIKNTDNYDFIIIADGYKGNIEHLISNMGESKVVIHPSVRKTRELDLIAEAHAIGIECHSLRLHSPLKYYR